MDKEGNLGITTGNFERPEILIDTPGARPKTVAGDLL